MDATIIVEQLDVMDFLVTITDAAGPTQHTVIVTDRDHGRYAPSASLQELVTEAVRFLLEREPHSLVEDHFGLEDVARIFPEFEFEMKRRFAA